MSATKVPAAARFTPTCVGTTPADDGHAGGEFGSPPRAWGQRRSHRRGLHGDRFTPTCVGTTHISLPLRYPDGRFTPTCVGTTSTQPRRIKSTAGSPPRAWGQRSRDDPFQGRGRFTPTCVGTTIANTAAASRIAVHPHVRGDNGSPRRSPRSLMTVHPHVRGDNFFVSPPLACVARFTPTCVGTTPRWSASGPASTVHPHVRGDNEHRGHLSRRSVRFTPTCVGTT